MVDLAREGDADGLCDHLLQQARHLALVVDLRPERRRTEVILGTERDLTLLLRAAHWPTGTHACKGEVAVDTGLDPLGQLPPVRSLEDTPIRDDLTARHPIGCLVSSCIRDAQLRGICRCRPGPEGVDAEGELGCDGLQVAGHNHACNAAVEDRRVHSLQRGGEVGARVVVLERDHVTLGCELDRGLGHEGRRPSPVEAAGELEVVVEVSLEEYLQRSARP